MQKYDLVVFDETDLNKKFSEQVSIHDFFSTDRIAIEKAALALYFDGNKYITLKDRYGVSK
jgi:hypothetical protein